MKLLLTIWIFWFLNTTGLHAQVYRTIHLKTIQDSVAFLSKKYYTSKYILVHKEDSLYVSPVISFNTDMGIHSPSHHYKFLDSIPDGIYKIVIDGKAIEKTTFVNKKKNGLQCSYDDQGSFAIRAYLDNKIIEYHKMDAQGNVLEYSPCLGHNYSPLATDFIYLFNNHKLSGIKYAFAGGSLQLTDHFKSNQLFNTTLYGSTNKPYRRGIATNQKLNGQMNVSYFDETYTFSFKNGILEKWHHESKKEHINQTFNFSSSSIKTKRVDLLVFCTE